MYGHIDCNRLSSEGFWLFILERNLPMCEVKIKSWILDVCKPVQNSNLINILNFILLYQIFTINVDKNIF